MYWILHVSTSVVSCAARLGARRRLLLSDPGADDGDDPTVRPSGGPKRMPTSRDAPRAASKPAGSPGDADLERADATLRRMRAPGTSEITTCQTYKTLSARGLATLNDVPRRAMAIASEIIR